MIEPLEQFKSTLKQHAHSLTKSRQLIFNAFQDKEPQTMAEIVAACQDQVDRASIYRNVAIFERLRIVQRLQIGWKYKLELSDAFHHHHHHLTCRHCSRTFPLPEDLVLEKRLRALAQSQNFLMSGHQLEIEGRCHSCATYNLKSLSERDYKDSV